MYVDISKIVDEIINNIINKLELIEKDSSNKIIIEINQVIDKIYILNKKDIVNKIKNIYLEYLKKEINNEKEISVIDYLFSNDNYLDSELTRIMKERDINSIKINKELINYLNKQKKLDFFERIIEQEYYPEQAKLRDIFKYLPF